MIKEQKFIFLKKKSDLLKILFEQGSILEEDEKDVKINYFGKLGNVFLNKINSGEDIINQKENREDIRMKSNDHLIYIKYKDIYIGGLSIFDFNSRESFGLNKYKGNECFYFGQWNHNMKEGIGFMKIDSSHLYLGTFHENQFDGFGILSYKETENLFIGQFKNCSIDTGIYLNISKYICYRGGFANGKKNCNFCSLLNMNSGKIFLGEIKDDLFVKGYLGLFDITKDDEGNILNKKLREVIYIDKTETNTTVINNNLFKENFYNKLKDAMEIIYSGDLELIEDFKNINEFFECQESICDDEEHNLYIGRYNCFNNSCSLDKELLENFMLYKSIIEQKDGKLVNLELIKREVETPKIKEK